MILAAYTALPVLLAAGVLIKKKALSALYCGALIFVFLLIAAPEGCFLYKTNETDVFGIAAPVGYSFLMRQIHALFPEPPAINAIFSAFFAVGVTKYIYDNSLTPALSALTAAACGAFMIALIEPCFFTAALICAFAFKYASQRRFLRFAALVLLASCFCFDALLLLPLYIAFLFPVGLSLLLGGTAVTAAVILTGAAGLFFRFAYGESGQTEGSSPIITAILAVICLWAAAMKQMLPSKDQPQKQTDSMIVTLFAAVLLSLCCVYDIRLMPVMMMCAFPALLSLCGTLAKTTGKLLALTFREKKKPVLIGCAVLGLILLGLLYAMLVSINAETLGITGGAL